VFEKSPKVKHRFETTFIINARDTNITLLAVLMILYMLA